MCSRSVEAAEVVDVGAHETITVQGDATSDAYREIESALRRVRDRHRREDVHVAFVYTMRKVGTDPDRWIYVVDAEEQGEDKSEIGEEVTWEDQYTSADEPMVLGPAYVDEQFTHDDYGFWLTGYAPLVDSDGTIVGLVGVDIEADAVIAQMNRAAKLTLAALGIAVSVAALLSILLTRWASKPLRRIGETARRIGEGHLETRIPETRKDEFGQLERVVNEMAVSLQERDALKGALSRFVSHETARKLIEEKTLPKLRGQRREVTVLVGDIANLNGLAGNLPPEKLVELLNEYFDTMVDIIFSKSGTIDRLLGDRLIAVFGALLEDDRKEHNALSAAIAMREAQKRLNEKWELEGDNAFRLGVGIHTGAAVVGNIGSRGNIEFTVVGESIDLAALIGAENRKFDTDTLASERTVEPVRSQFALTEVGDIQPRSVGEFIRVYSVRGLVAAQET